LLNHFTVPFIRSITILASETLIALTVRFSVAASYQGKTVRQRTLSGQCGTQEGGAFRGEPIEFLVSGLSRRGMERIAWRRIRPIFWTGNIQIHHNRFLAAAYDYGFHRFVFAGI